MSQLKTLLVKIFLIFLLILIPLSQPINVFAQIPSVYSGVYSEDISSFEADSGKNVSIQMFFQDWTSGGFPSGKMSDIRSHGSIPVVSWQSYNPEDAGTTWENIGSGSKDEYIKQWARDAKNWGHPFFLRLDWEMNGNWEPNAKQTDKYVYMWKHVHDIFVAEGAANVTWVWCPNIDGGGTQNFDQMYPGGDYVDWVCMDGYNFGNTQSWGSWQNFSQLYAPTYNHLLKLAPGKPIMIGEFASSENGGSKPDWISDFLNTQLPKFFPNIKAIVWFNIDKETDWRIESSEASKKAYSSGISSSYYASNSFGDLSTSPIPYLGALSSQPAGYVVPSATIKPTPKPTLKPTLAPTENPTSTPSAEQTIVLSEKSENSIFEKYADEWWKFFVLLILLCVVCYGSIRLKKPKLF